MLSRDDSIIFMPSLLQKYAWPRYPKDVDRDVADARGLRRLGVHNASCQNSITCPMMNTSGALH